MDIIKYKTQKAVAHAARAPQLFGFGLFITSTYLSDLAAWKLLQILKSKSRRIVATFTKSSQQLIARYNCYFLMEMRSHFHQPTILNLVQTELRA